MYRTVATGEGKKGGCIIFTGTNRFSVKAADGALWNVPEVQQKLVGQVVEEAMEMLLARGIFIQ